jgi:hypothetical protein
MLGPCAFLGAGRPWSTTGIVTEVSAREKKIAPCVREAGSILQLVKRRYFTSDWPALARPAA